MEIIGFQKTTELRRARKELEKKLKVEIKIQGRRITVNSKKTLDEYEASQVLEAINFGFSAKKALLIKEQGMLLRIINIKDFTRKKNLKEVRARIIGKQGKTKKTIENISDCPLILRDNEMGIIGYPESIEELIGGITRLIRGTKQSNTYRYLEKMKTGHKGKPSK